MLLYFFRDFPWIQLPETWHFDALHRPARLISLAFEDVLEKSTIGSGWPCVVVGIPQQSLHVFQKVPLPQARQDALLTADRWPGLHCVLARYLVYLQVVVGIFEVVYSGLSSESSGFGGVCVIMDRMCIPWLANEQFTNGQQDRAPNQYVLRVPQPMLLKCNREAGVYYFCPTRWCWWDDL